MLTISCGFIILLFLPVICYPPLITSWSYRCDLDSLDLERLPQSFNARKSQFDPFSATSLGQYCTRGILGIFMLRMFIGVYQSYYGVSVHFWIL